MSGLSASAWSPVPAPAGTLFESARWIADAGVFQWVDILGATVHRWDPADGTPVETRRLPSEFVTAALPLDASRSLVAFRDELHVYDWETDTLDHRGRWSFDPDVRFNDGGISPSGEIFIGTMSMSGRSDAGTLFQFDDGELTPVVTGVGISNGLVWDSPGTAFYADSAHDRIDRLVWRDGGVERSPFHTFDGATPDGMTLAPDGCLVVALWEAGALALLCPGRSERRWPTPLDCPSSVALGGPDGTLLLATFAAGKDRGGVLVTTLAAD